MRTLNIVCPKCSEIIEFDSLADINTCENCLFSIDFDESADETKQLKELVKQLRAQLKKKYDAVAITDICDKILGHDIHFSDAWAYKGMCTDNMAEKLACYYNCVRTMDVDEYNDLFATLSDDIVATINGYEAEWNPRDVARIDTLFKENAPEDAKSEEFLLDIMNKLNTEILRCEDTFHIKTLFYGYSALAIASLCTYEEIPDQVGILESAIGDIDEMIKAYRHSVPPEEKGYANADVAGYLREGRRFIAELHSALDEKNRKLGDEQMEDVCNQWDREQIIPLVGTLLEAYALSERTYAQTPKGAARIKEIQTQFIDMYVDDYVYGHISQRPEICKLLEDEEEYVVESEEIDPTIRISRLTYDKSAKYPNDYRKIIDTCRRNLSSPEVDALIDDNYYGIVEDLGGLNTEFLPSKKLIEWLRFCAERGYVRAQMDYGICLFKGFGIEKDQNAGKNYLKKASEGGYYEASYILNAVDKRTKIFSNRMELQTPEENAEIIFEIFKMED